MTSNSTILLVDDEPDMLVFLESNLIREGYQVHTAKNGIEGVEKAITLKPDLIFMDIVMPEMDGIEACVQIREHKDLNNVIIAILTAREEDYSQEAAFKAGADDYIIKPIKANLLLSRVKALLKRSHLDEEHIVSAMTCAGQLRIDKDCFTVFMGDVKIYFPRKQFEFITLLASSPNKVFTRDEIIDALWKDDEYVNDRIIDVHLRKIREKIGEETVRTIRGVGYTINH